MRMHKRVGVTVLLLAMSVVTVIAMSPTHTFESATPVASFSDPGASAMRIYLDNDGNPTSTPTENAVFTVDPEMEHLLRHDSEGLNQVKLANGGDFLQNDGRYGDVMIIRVGENGKQTVCVNDAKAFASTMTSTAPTGPEVK